MDGEIICSKCGDSMVKRQGKNGEFMACVAYPDCTNTQSMGKEAVEPTRLRKAYDEATTNTLPTPETHKEASPKMRTTRTYAEVSAGEIIKEAVKLVTISNGMTFEENVEMVIGEFKRVRDSL